MKKPAKKPVQAKGAKAVKPGKRGLGTVRGIKVHKRIVAVSTMQHPAPAHHHVHHPAKKPKPAKTAKAAKKRQWSPGSDVACCSAEALGFLLGWDAEEVLNTYWRMARDPDEGATIGDTLKAANGVAGRDSNPQTPIFGVQLVDFALAATRRLIPIRPPVTPGLILGVSLPEPHAVAVTPDGTWWSWGEPFNPGDWPELVIEEAWAVCAG